MSPCIKNAGGEHRLDFVEFTGYTNWYVCLDCGEWEQKYQESMGG